MPKTPFSVAIADAYTRKDFAAMRTLADTALAQHPADDYAAYLLGIALRELGALQEAEAAFNKAIAINPDASNAKLHLATTLRRMGKEDEAEKAFKALLKTFPHNDAVAGNLSFLFNTQKRYKETKALLTPFVAKNSVDEGVIINFGNACRGTGDIKRARTMYERALKLNGRWRNGALANMAMLDFQENKLKQARQTLVQLHEAGTIPPEGYLNLALIDSREDQTETALEWLRLAEEQGFMTPASIVNYASNKAKLGDPLAGIERIRTYCATHPADFSLFGEWLSIAQKNCCFEDVRTASKHILQLVQKNKLDGISEGYLFGLMACDGLSPQQVLRMAQQVASRISIQQKHFVTALPVNQKKTQPKKLRIGYLSADFRDHPVAHLMIGIFKNHDRAKFEVYGYNIGKEDHSVYRYRSIAYLDTFVEAAEMGFEELAQRIHEDKIDVLIDLCGYTECCKPQTLCYKPAPVIISYLGFVGTLGIPEVDYIIADDIVMPQKLAHFYTEKPIYIPRCYQATDGTLQMETVTRTEMGLPEDRFVFASFNNTYKMNPRFVGLWARLLTLCPDAVLWLYAKGLVRDNLVNEFTRLGVDPSRLFFYKRQTKARFLGALACADLFLDSSPYNAGTTASDALYAGCPVLTLPEAIYSSRMAASIVTHAGLQELVCSSEEDYIETAKRLYEDTEYRKNIRTKAEQARTTRLFDTIDATRCLESAYSAAYARFAAGKKPAHITIPDPGWTKDNTHQRPFAGTKLNQEEITAITQKLRTLGGEKAVETFREHITPVATQTTQAEQVQSVEKSTPEPNTAEQTEVRNFFNPVFWGTKDPDTFSDLMRIAAKQTTGYHFADNMFVFQRNNSMLHDECFVDAWKKNCISKNDTAIVWRRYILAMAGFHCQHLEGDFVECGAYEGSGSKIVLDYLGGKSFPKTFWLYDLFEHPKDSVHHAMPSHGKELHSQVLQRFAEYKNVNIYKGFLPDVLKEGSPEKIAWLHLDLNQAPAEIGCLDALFDRVVPGGMIILDDYEMLFYRAQKRAEDDWFGKRGYKVFPLPTSQGFVIKR